MKNETPIAAHQGSACASHSCGRFFYWKPNKKGKENRNFGALAKELNTKTFPVTFNGVF